MIVVHIYSSSRYQVDKQNIEDRVTQLLKTQGVADAQVDISIVGSRKIIELNEEKMGHQGETDVLSFPQHEKKKFDDFPMPNGLPPHLGDIVVCFPFAVKEAAKFGRMVDEQIGMYVEHSVMHLLGYHHD